MSMKERLHILHLEDEPDFAELVRTLLAQDGLDVEVKWVGDRVAFLQALETDALVVESLRSFYVGSEEVTGKEFVAFAASLMQSHPGILAVQWAPRTDPSAGAPRSDAHAVRQFGSTID